MKKANVIIASILGFLVIIISIILFMRPFVLKKYASELEKEEIQEEKIQENGEEQNTDESTKNIQLGINILYDGEGISIDEAISTITINKGGTYNIIGNLISGKIIVDTNSDVTLNFQGVNITNSDTILDIKSNKKVTINLEGGTYNYFTSNSATTMKASGNLKLTGSGTLNIIANGGNGIDCAALTIENGNITMNASQSPINASQSYTISGGQILALGSSNLENISDSTTLPTIGFKLPQKITNNDILALVNSAGNNIMNIKPTMDVDTIIIASANIISDNYNLIKDFGNTNEKIIIQNQDTFNIDKTINYFK